MFERFNFRERMGEIPQEDEPITETPSERAGYSFTLGTRQVVFLISGYFFLCVLVFALGVVVGRAISQPESASEATASLASLPREQPATARQDVLTGSHLPPASPSPGKGAGSEGTTGRAKPLNMQEAALSSALTATASKPAEKRETEPAVPRTSPSLPADYTVQVSAFRTLEQANELKGRLSKRGYGAYVQSVALNDKGTWHRVRVGNFRDKEGAERVASGIRTRENLPALVTRR